MLRPALACLAIASLACASAPRGPTDAEVRATLDERLQQVVGDIGLGNTEGVLTYFAADASMALRGVMGPDGAPLNVDLTGIDQIRPFMNQTGAPPEFYMQVSGFTRTGTEAEQTGRWSIAGEQTGPFTVRWRQSTDGAWLIVHWRFGGP